MVMKKDELKKNFALFPQMKELDGVRIDHSFNIEVIFDSEVNVWVALCDEIGLATEGDSHDAVIKRANLIIPELIKANGFPARDANYVLNYVTHRVALTFN